MGPDRPEGQRVGADTGEYGEHRGDLPPGDLLAEASHGDDHRDLAPRLELHPLGERGGQGTSAIALVHPYEGGDHERHYQEESD
jgi:hypothetical protein